MSTYPLATSNFNRLQLLGSLRAARAAKSGVRRRELSIGQIARWPVSQLASWQRQQLMYHPLFGTFAPAQGPRRQLLISGISDIRTVLAIPESGLSASQRFRHQLHWPVYVFALRSARDYQSRIY